MRVFFASSLRQDSASGRQRIRAMRQLGHEVEEFCLDEFEPSRSLTNRVRARMRAQITGDVFEAASAKRLGDGLVTALSRTCAQIVWIEKALMLQADWLAAARARAPNARFVCFQDDDPFGERIRERPTWKHFVECIPLYDVHFVKRPANIAEFEAHRAKHVYLFMHGSCPELFYPRSELQTRERHALVFVGTPLDHRIAAIRELLGKHRLPLDIYGPPSWRRSAAWWLYRRRFHPEIGGEHYARVLARSRIALGFVSSSNRDEYSMRTFEIPASGALLLAERTPVHQQLFVEGSEAEFFESIDECADKSRFYLANEGERARVARRGYNRSIEHDYTLLARIEQALNQVMLATRPVQAVSP